MSVNKYLKKIIWINSKNMLQRRAFFPYYLDRVVINSWSNGSVQSVISAKFKDIKRVVKYILNFDEV